jgi:signal transduction histidine kinase
MVRGFVETAGGSLGVQSELGRGTRFTIELPRLAGA